jgi:hypothetical protein
MAKTLEAERYALDFAGFAQEFLRRNPTYRIAYEAVMRDSQIDRMTVAQETMAQLWGLRFPMCAGPIRCHRACHLARGDFSHDRRARHGRSCARRRDLG